MAEGPPREEGVAGSCPSQESCRLLQRARLLPGGVQESPFPATPAQRAHRAQRPCWLGWELVGPSGARVPGAGSLPLAQVNPRGASPARGPEWPAGPAQSYQPTTSLLVVFLFCPVQPRLPAFPPAPGWRWQSSEQQLLSGWRAGT